MTYNSVPVDDCAENREPLGQIIGETRDAQMETVAYLADILTILTADQSNVADPPAPKCFMDSCKTNRELAFCCRELARRIRASFGG